MTYIKSINDNQQQILNDIIILYNNGNAFDCDPTFSKGVFYKNNIVPEPRLKFDLTPQTDDTVKASSDDLPLESSSINSIVFDPPFVISGKAWKESDEGSCKISKRFGAYYNFEELKTHYYNSLKEFYRILSNNGIVVFKYQNTVSSGKNHFTDLFVKTSAIDIGFNLVDEFILLSKSKMTSFGGRWKTQRHALKYHSYFLVLRKEKNKVDYKLDDYKDGYDGNNY